MSIIADPKVKILKNSVADPEPDGSETFGRIRIRSGTEINVLDPDSNPDPKPDSNPEPK